jgi:hypothetical protein
MGKWTTFGLLLTTALIGVLVASLVPAASQGGGGRFVICEKNGRHDYEQDVDNDDSGDFSAGDTVLFSEPEYDSNGDRIGKSAGTATLVRMDGGFETAIVQLHVSLNLKGGRLEVQGAIKGVNFGKKPDYAVIGGTGRFAGAGGSVTVDERAGCGGFPKADKLTFELQ